MTDLSPAAQAVLTAITQHQCGLDPADVPNETARFSSVAATALRELADLVAPVRAVTEDMSDVAWQRHQMSVIINNRIRKIATELENHQCLSH